MIARTRLSVEDSVSHDSDMRGNRTCVRKM